MYFKSAPVVEMLNYGKQNVIFLGFIQLLPESDSILTSTIPCSLCLSHVMDTLWSLSVPIFFMMADGWPYTQCSALSIMSCTLIPKLGTGTACVVHMKVSSQL